MNKQTLLSILLVFSNNVICMEIQSQPKQNLLLTIPQDVKDTYNINAIKMSDIKPENQQWWYLDQIVQHKNWLKTVSFDPTDNNLITTSNGNNKAIFDIKSGKLTAVECTGSCKGKKECYDPSKKLFAICDSFFDEPRYNQIHNDTVSIFKTIDIWQNEKEKTVSFHYSGEVMDICFNHTGTSFATANKKFANIFKQHKDYTLEQLQLKQAMNTWLLLKRPVLVIEKEKVLLKDILPALLKEIADKKIFVPHCEQLTIKDELLTIWNSFPTNMQLAILRTMKYKIERYGDINNVRPKLH